MLNVAGLPFSELGRCTGRFHLDDRFPLIAMRCYFDGSLGQDDSASEWLTLGGYIASDAFWGEFQTKWMRMLRERYPMAPYVHMYELLSGDDPFERIAGWTKEKIDQLVRDALEVLQHLNKTAFRSLVCSIDVSARTRLLAEGYEIPDPAVICAETCIGQGFKWYIETHPDDIELAYLFFDRGERFMYSIKERWLTERTPPGKVATHLFWDLLANVEEVDMERNPPVQAADMLAWARTRSLSTRTRPWRHLADMMTAIIPRTSVTITEEIMRRKYPKRG